MARERKTETDIAVLHQRKKFFFVFLLVTASKILLIGPHACLHVFRQGPNATPQHRKIPYWNYNPRTCVIYLELLEGDVHLTSLLLKVVERLIKCYLVILFWQIEVFHIEDSVGLYVASLQIPKFMKEKPQLSELEIETTRSLANVRIYLARLTGTVRQKYTILGQFYRDTVSNVR